jgi:hypothetical protein
MLLKGGVISTCAVLLLDERNTIRTFSKSKVGVKAINRTWVGNEARVKSNKQNVGLERSWR